mgnify:CR=1 FL=1
MLDRLKLEAILRRRFPGATDQQVATASNAIMGLDDEWEESACRDIGHLVMEFDRGAEFRVLRRVSSGA